MQSRCWLVNVTVSQHSVRGARSHCLTDIRARYWLTCQVTCRRLLLDHNAACWAAGCHLMSALPPALPPPQIPPPSLFEIKSYFKNIKFYYANQCVPRRHKNKYWNKWATSEEYWYALEYKALLISTSTNFLQPSLTTPSRNGVKTLRTQDISAPVPKCPDTSAPSSIVCS